VAIRFAGKRLNRPVRGFHPQTGQPVVFINRHPFFGVPMQYWGPVLAVATVIVGVLVGTA
jgi:hypothetical protein